MVPPPGDKVNYTINYLITGICANRPPFLPCLQIPSCPINYVSIAPSDANLVRNFPISPWSSTSCSATVDGGIRKF